jgi:hypothetical protein
MHMERYVAEPHHLGEDPDPAFHLNADPDPTFHFDASKYRLKPLKTALIGSFSIHFGLSSAN